MDRINALSIDVEDWYHPELVRSRAGESPPSQIVEATLPILDLLDQYETKASFFVLGDLAEKNPDLIRAIYQRGHEIGCHGFSHKPLWALDEHLLREELKHFQLVMEGIVGRVKIKGFRAPTFSLDPKTQWAVRVLIEEGFEYDASIFPVKLNRLYGVDGAPTRPYRISPEDVLKEDPGSPLVEFPMPLLNIGRWKIPISGGFYLRVIPLPILLWGLKRINLDQPFLLYFHPWEGYEKTPRLDLPLYNRLISYYGVNSARRKLKTILDQFRFTRVDRVLGLG